MSTVFANDGDIIERVEFGHNIERGYVNVTFCKRSGERQTVIFRLENIPAFQQKLEEHHRALLS